MKFTEFVKKQWKGLSAGFVAGFLPTFIVLLVGTLNPGIALLVLGLWLSGILASVGAFPLGLVILGLSLLAGIAGLLLVGGILYLKMLKEEARLQDLQEGENEIPFYGSNGHSPLSTELILSEINYPEVMLETDGLSENESAGEDINHLVEWGKQIGQSLLEKVQNQQEPEAGSQFEAEMRQLRIKFYRLARKYHPDRNRDLEAGQRTGREELCKVLLVAYENIQKQWESALKGKKTDFLSADSCNDSSDPEKDDEQWEQRLHEMVERLRREFAEETREMREQNKKRDEQNKKRDEQNKKRDEQINQLLEQVPVSPQQDTPRCSIF